MVISTTLFTTNMYSKSAESTSVKKEVSNDLLVAETIETSSLIIKGEVVYISKEFKEKDSVFKYYYINPSKTYRNMTEYHKHDIIPVKIEARKIKNTKDYIEYQPKLKRKDKGVFFLTSLRTIEEGIEVENKGFIITAGNEGVFKKSSKKYVSKGNKKIETDEKQLENMDMKFDDL